MKKTLTVRPPEDRPEIPQLQKRGRGWNIAESRLDTLHETARELRRNPTAAQELLAAKLIEAQLGKYKFKRQAVIGSAIVDFACQPLRVVVCIDEEADSLPARHRDKSLEAVGIQVLRFPAAEVLANVDAVVTAIVAAMKLRWQEQRSRPRPQAGGRGYAR